MRIAIISSYQESCGNASFTSIIKNSLEKNGNEVTVFGLNLFFTQSNDPKMVTVATQKIRSLVPELKEYDGVNLQFEPGLYGPTSKLILKRLNLLLRANSNTTVTIHSTRYFNTVKRNVLRESLKLFSALKIRTFVSYLANQIKLTIDTKINRSYLKVMIKNNCKLIVHTTSSYETITQFWGYPKVFIHPLKFQDNKSIIPSRDKWNQELGTTDEDILIGLFGYLSKYKGHLTAIEAMRYLPSNYKLVIAGRQHPQSIQEHISVDPYIEKMIQRIEEIDETEKGFFNRFIFCNEIGEPEFSSLVASVDFAWLPYLEVGQDASGIASIIFDCASKVVASNAKSFDELLILEENYQCERFDIGNYLELSGKTLRYNKISGAVKTNYSLASQANLYQELFQKDSDF
jgi:glycosyltransferase involved in cell wall biosynthesis